MKLNGERPEHSQQTFQQDFYCPAGDIAFEGFVTMEQLASSNAAKGDFTPIPEECARQMVAMDLNLGGEASA